MDFDARLQAVKALYDAGKFQEALEPARALSDEAQRTYGRDEPRSARAIHRLAEVVYELEGPEAALPLHLEALKIRERVLGPDDLEIAESLNVLGNCHMYGDRYQEAAAAHGRALALRKKANPNSEDVAQVLNNIAHARMRQGADADAMGVLEEAAAIFERQASPRYQDLGIVLSNLAGVHRALGNDDEAERFYRRALEAKQKVLEPGHPSLAITLGNLGVQLEKMGKGEEADRLFQRSLEINEERFGPDDPRVTGEQVLLAMRLQGRGRLKEAEELLRKTVAAAQRHGGSDHLDVGARLMSLARFLVHHDREADASAELDRAIAIAEKAGADGMELKADALESRAQIVQQAGDLPAAEALFLRSLEAREAQVWCSPSALALSLLLYADLCFQLGRGAKAQALYQRAWPVLDDDADFGDVMAVHVCLQLTALASGLGQHADAPRWARRALARLAVEESPQRALIDEALNALEGPSARPAGLLAKLGTLVGGPRERPELWVAALEASVEEGRVADAQRLAKRTAELAAGTPALAGRVEKVLGKLKGEGAP